MTTIEKCYPRVVWCGKGNKPRTTPQNQKIYTKKGTPTECLRQGFGAGMYMEKKRGLPKNSVQQITYVGKKHEEALTKKGVETLGQLKALMRSKTAEEKKKFLYSVLKRKDGLTDTRAYNSVILYLYNSGIKRLPDCN